MVSTISSVFSSELGLTNPFSAFETGFTPWDGSDLFSPFDLLVDPFETNPDSEKPDPVQTLNQTDSTSGFEEKSQNQTGSHHLAAVFNERREKRKISNRESARRSRMRKQKHLENMRIQLNRLKIENRELTNRLRYVLYHCQRAQTENDRLQVEHRILQHKLLNIRQALALRRQIQRRSTYSMAMQ